VEVSSPNKLIYPDDGITKADVVGHYEVVAPDMLAFVSGRPLTLQRFPRGIGAKGFMQKNAGQHFPATIRRFPVPKRDGGETVYPVVDRADDLTYLANQNTLTFHMWSSSMDRPHQPDWMIIDLDPLEGEVDAARDATHAIHSILDDFDLEAFALATGSKGFHVWIPLAPGAIFDDVSLVSRSVAGLAVLADPAALTTEFLKKERKGRVFVDWLRNGPTATVVAPFSLRPRPGAPMAVPVRWDELDAARPDQWRLGDDIADRVAAVPCLVGQRLPVGDIVEQARSAGVDLDTPHDRFGRR
jgi:bifunctional non-homologous end joining protein LigD